MLQKKITDAMQEIANDMGQDLTCNLCPDSVLLETGLDSLGFARLVAHLEDELGYDPFGLMEEPFYPRTLRELVGIYEKYAP